MFTLYLKMPLMVQILKESKVPVKNLD